MAGKEKLNEVQKDAIHEEMIKKEKRHEILQTRFTFNPHRRPHVLTEKPMSRKTEEMAENSEFMEAFQKARLVPTMKYSAPQTSGQEIGWWVSTPPILPNPNGKTFNFHRCCTDITK
ncbi:protein FAM183A [Pungitius pungitius]|uniref:protein FAM183A n=1 Tax=Pungitius pungitius TaxID=134920 RepID=UPI002E1155AA